MNNDEMLSLLRKVVIIALTSYATKLHIDNSQLTAMVTDLIDLGAVVWGVYAHWNMKKVPETAVVIDQQGGARS